MLETSVELGYLRKAYQIQKDYIEGKIDKETFEKQMSDANCMYKFYLQAETERFRNEKMQIDMIMRISRLLTKHTEG